MKSGTTSPQVSEKDNGLIVSADIRNEVANEVISDRKKGKKNPQGQTQASRIVFFFLFFLPSRSFYIWEKKKGRK